MHELAAEKGDAPAKTNLGVVYGSGHGADVAHGAMVGLNQIQGQAGRHGTKNIAATCYPETMAIRIGPIGHEPIFMIRYQSAKWLRISQLNGYVSVS